MPEASTPTAARTNSARSRLWNRGLKKGDHPSLARMGFQPDHKPYNDWSHVNAKLRDDPEIRAKWIKSKKGQVAWNTGLKRDQYPNGIATGSAHGNWDGGKRGDRDTAEYRRFRQSIFRRDNYTCQLCGARNHRGRGRTVRLEVDHKDPVWKAPDRVLDPSNAQTLCRDCHYRTETFGSKAARTKRLTQAAP